MQHFGLLGAKLGHSLSPQIHGMIFEELGIDADYKLLELPAEALKTAVPELAQSYTGVNVTIPHKIEVMPFLDSISAEAAAIGAVNTISFSNGKSCGYNTDWLGFGMMLEYYGIKAEGKKALSALTTTQDVCYPGTPYMYHYYIQSLIDCGMNLEAKEALVNYWGGMIAKGADTFWEAYDPTNDG